MLTHIRALMEQAEKISLSIIGSRTGCGGSGSGAPTSAAGCQPGCREGVGCP